MLRLGITRSESHLGNLTKKAKENGIEIVPIPLLEPSPLLFEWPASIRIDEVDWILFTSVNGVQTFFSRLAQLGITLPLSTRIGAVGKVTAEAAVVLGKHVEFVPSEPYGKSLFTEFILKEGKQSQTIVYAHGRQIDFDPSILFAITQLKYLPIECYEMVTAKTSVELISSFKTDDFILFTAASAVKAYSERFGTPTARPLAIGNTTASAMQSLNWNNFSVLDEPDITKALEFLI